MGKSEELLETCGYVVRYEKGNFNSSSCRLHANRIIVVNKFLNVEQRNMVLMDLILDMGLNKENWSAKQQKWFQQLNDWKQKN